MSVEIRELVIKAEVSSNETPRNNTKTVNSLDPSLKTKLIEECVERILEMLDRRKQK